MAKSMCKVPDCEKPVTPGGGQGMCCKHYKRWRKYGDPLKTVPHGYRGLTDEQRFWPKVNKDGPIPVQRPELGPCWMWTAAAQNDLGYGAFGIASTPELPDRKPRIISAHRFSYELVHGPVSPGLDLDHLCRNPPCVNPSHLEAVTHRVNVLRGISPAAQHARKETCPEGHDYDVLRVRKNGRVTRRCSRCERRDDGKESGPMVACACGCGTEFLQMKYGRARRFVHGHNMRRAA